MIQEEDALGKVIAKVLPLGYTMMETNINSIFALKSNMKKQKICHSLLIIRHWLMKKFMLIGPKF